VSPDARIPPGFNQLPDPYPLLARLRDAGPVCAVGNEGQTPAWIITRHTEVMQALSDHRLSSDPARDAGAPGGQLDSHVSRTTFAGSLITSDPPRHTWLRQAIMPFLTRQHVSSLAPFIEQTANSLIDGFADGLIDAVADFAAPLTVLTICRFLGLPASEYRNILRWSHDLMTEQTDQAARHRSRQGGQALALLLADFLASQHDRPGPGLAGALLAAPGTRLTGDDILTMTMLMLVAGHETSIGLISAAIWRLLCDSETACAIRRHPEIVPVALAEILRYDGPVTMTIRRIATSCISYPDAVIHAGDHVFLCLASANRDERRFPAASQLIFGRSPKPHLAFCHGIHRCPGAALAFRESRIAIDLLIRRTRDLALAVPASELTWRPGELRCLQHLPVHTIMRNHP
jgi:cytochrome P450